MNFLPGKGELKSWMAAAALTPLTAALLVAVTPNVKSFTAGEKANAKGVIISHEGDSLKIRGDDETVETVDLTSGTKIQLKHGIFGKKSAMDNSSLVPGLHIEAQGKGNDKG